MVAYGSASVLSFTAYGTPSSADSGLPAWILHGTVISRLEMRSCVKLSGAKHKRQKLS